MKDMKDFPLSVSVDNILSAYGSRARCWGEACSWLEKYPARVDELDLLKMSEEFWHGAILFFRRRLDSGMALHLRQSKGESVPC